MSAIVDARFEELKRLKHLPSPSGVALEIMRLAQREDVTVAEVANVIQADPALTGRLLHLANSAGQNGRRPVLAVNDVVTRLGLALVRQTALSFSLVSDHRSGLCEGFDFAAFWSHSLATGIAAQHLARHLNAAAPDECFVLGLLANVGTLALATVYPQQYARLLRQAGNPDSSALPELERDEFAMDHAEISAAMLTDWGFPDVFVKAALNFGNPRRFQPAEGSRTAQLSALLSLAASLASMCVQDDAGRKRHLAQLYRRGAHLAVGGEELAIMLPQVVEAWRKWGQMLTIATQDVPTLAQIEQARQEVPPLPTHEQSDTVAGLDILLVDDDRSALEVMSSWLRAGGHQVRTARNGDEALQALVKAPPQVAITDWEMPVMDGLKLCKTVRQSSSGRQIYVIIVTGHGNEDRLTEAFAAGADDYITKPLRQRELQARLCAARRFIEVHQTSVGDSAELRAIASELVIANRRLKYLARTDELTGLPNRRYSMERLEQELSSAQRRKSGFGLLVGDIDLFKQINDSQGHQHGDAVLRAVARALRSTARAEDMVGRVGGEEFMVIVPGVDAAGLMALAERMRAAVGALRRAGAPRAGEARPGEAWPGEPPGGTITISFGATLSRPADSTSRELVRRCDEALYRAKHEGRNRVILAG